MSQKTFVTTTKRKKINAEKIQPAFATAHQIARAIRKALQQKFGKLGDKRMLDRLSLAVSDWLKSSDREAHPSALSEFSFTDPDHSFKEIWKVRLEIDDLYDGDKVVKIPALNPVEKIIPPAGTRSILCFGHLVVIDVYAGKPISISGFTNIFTFKNKVYPEKIFKLEAPKNKGNLTIVCITLVYFGEMESGKSVQLGQSSGIVAALYRK